MRSLERCPQLRHSLRRRNLEPRANLPKVAKVPREAISPCMRVPDLGAQSTRTRTALKLTKSAASAVRIGHIASARRSSGQARQPKGAKTTAREAMVQAHRAGNVVRLGMSGHAVAEKTPASQDGRHRRCDRKTLRLFCSRASKRE